MTSESDSQKSTTGLRFGADRGARHAEEEGEDDDLQHFAARHGVDDAGREGVFENLGKAGAGLGEAGGCAFLQLHADSRLDQIHGAQADEERDGGDDFEIENGFAADAAHGLHVARAGDAGDQRAEEQRRDDRFDQAQEDGAQDGEGDRLFRKQNAEDDSRDESDHDPRGERYAFDDLL